MLEDIFAEPQKSGLQHFSTKSDKSRQIDRKAAVAHELGK